MSERWAVPLEGDVLDVEDAKRFFARGSIRIKEVEVERQQFALAMQADEFECKDDYIEVLAIAERFLDYLNGALFLTDTTRRPLRIVSGGTVRERSDTGLYDRRNALGRLSGTTRVRFSASGTLTAVGGQPSTMEQEPQPPIEAEALALSARDKAVAEVLSYLRTNPDHQTLYNVYECIERDIIESRTRWNTSGRTGAPPEFPWTSNAKRKLKQNSQPFRHGDPELWRGLTRETAMPLSQAQGLVQGWVRQWLEWKRLSL